MSLVNKAPDEKLENGGVKSPHSFKCVSTPIEEKVGMGGMRWELAKYVIHSKVIKDGSRVSPFYGVGNNAQFELKFLIEK